MPPIIRAGVVQGVTPEPAEPTEAIRERMLDSYLRELDRAADMGVRIMAFPELFCYPWFPATDRGGWDALAEEIPGGPVLARLQETARLYGMVLVAPIYERTGPGSGASTALVLDADGELLGTYQKQHVPDMPPAHRERRYFSPGEGGYPVFQTRVGVVGVIIGYDRHFPETVRALTLKGAELVFACSAAHAGAAERLWELEPAALAVQNQVFLGAANRVGLDLPGPHLRFFGASLFCSHGGRILARASKERPEMVHADLDLGRLREARRRWDALQRRRPETYLDLVAPRPVPGNRGGAE